VERPSKATVAAVARNWRRDWMMDMARFSSVEIRSGHAQGMIGHGKAPAERTR
jgi:hypothetical protein